MIPQKNKSGNNGEKVTPVPIPNTEVKLLSADGSWGLSPCESRTLPGKAKQPRVLILGCFFGAPGMGYNLVVKVHYRLGSRNC